MRRRMTAKICLRLPDPAFTLIENIAHAESSTNTQVARRILIERLADLAIERGLVAAAPAADTGAAAA